MIVSFASLALAVYETFLLTFDSFFAPFKQMGILNSTTWYFSAGQSLQAWYRYFPTAEIHAFDVMWYGEDLEVSVKDNSAHLKPRVKAHIVNILREVDNMAELGFLPESMESSLRMALIV
jgi:hypothetical protein